MSSVCARSTCGAAVKSPASTRTNTVEATKLSGARYAARRNIGANLNTEHSKGKLSRQVLSRTTVKVCGSADSGLNELWMPPLPETNLILPANGFPSMPEVIAGSAAPGAAAGGGGGYSEHRPKTPPPDLPSLMLDSRIVYLGMPLVPAVTELIVAELLYLQYTDPNKPIYLYINSTGCNRADGETVGFETEATAIYDTMSYVSAPIYTVGVGVAVGQACMLLASGQKGKRFMLPHATAMLQQPRVPSTGSRQAVEIYIKWQEVLRMKKTYLDILSLRTGHSIDKLDRDMLRPLYMQPKDAIAYGVCDEILSPDKEPGIDTVKSSEQWDSDAGLVQQPVRS